MRRSAKVGLGGLGGLGLAALAATAAVCLGSGCSTIGYYAQSVTGHLNLVEAARPVSQWLDDPATSPALKERLALATNIRDFAVAQLHEPDNQSYRRYADLHRKAAVWNVVAAPELSLELKTWCFWVVGCVGYRGYYDEPDADALAAGLRGEGFEVAVYPVPAYSTLGRVPQGGWLADPLLNTFVFEPDGDLARLVFHELAHQIAFAPGDTVFNESFATSVERIGADRWLATHASAEARAAMAASDARHADFIALTRRYRGELQTLYAGAANDADKRAQKAAIYARMRADYARLKTERWQGYAGYDRWFATANNATLGVQSAYDELVPAFERLFDREGRDFPAFYAEVRRLASLKTARERREALGAAAAASSPAS